MINQFSIPDKPTIAPRLPPDWASDLPGKFTSRLVLYLPNKDLGNFSVVCKRWNIAAYPLMKKRVISVNEAREQDFRIRRRIYDAKRKVKAFIHRNPNSMNSAQKADLARSKQLLLTANLYDLGMKNSL